MRISPFRTRHPILLMLFINNATIILAGRSSGEDGSQSGSHPAVIDRLADGIISEGSGR